MPDVAFGRGGWRAGAGDVMGIELLGKSFSCETLTECLLQGQEDVLLLSDAVDTYD